MAVFRLMTNWNLVGPCTGELTRLRTAKDAIHIRRRLPIQIQIVGSVGHQAAILGEVVGRVDRRQAMVCRQRDRLPAMIDIGNVGQHDETTVRLARERIDGALDVGGVMHHGCDHLVPRWMERRPRSADGNTPHRREPSWGRT